jgi:ribosomal protein S17E
MGRIKTTMVKRLSHKLIKDYGCDFKNDFDENKNIMNGLLENCSPKMRNVVAGYVTRLVKKGIE